jgi:hypothetical protein
MGQSLPKQAVRATSAFRPIATTERTSRHVSKVPLTAVIRTNDLTEPPPLDGAA